MKLIRTSLLTFALIVSSTICFRLHKPMPPPSEVLRSALTPVDGKLHKLNDSSLFNGWMIERYSNGTLRSRSQVANGLLNGLSEGWTEKGRLSVRENFLNGVSHGLRTKWRPNGAKMSEGTIDRGKVVGVFRRWHENGELAQVIHLKDGQQDGESWAFYSSGFVQGMARHENGALVQHQSWKDGERKLPNNDQPQ